LQYCIAILSIANTDFSIAKVLQYCLKIYICIGIANTFSSIGKSNYYQITNTNANNFERNTEIKKVA